MNRNAVAFHLPVGNGLTIRSIGHSDAPSCSAATELSLASPVGDFVELTTGSNDSDDTSYIQGYIIEHLNDENEVRVAVDGFTMTPRGDRPRIVTVSMEDVRVIRKHGAWNRARVCDVATATFACHGTAISTCTKKSRMDAESSAYGRLARPCATEMPGPHSIDSLFKNPATETLYRDAYSGNTIVLEWNHTFCSAQQLEYLLPVHCIKVYLRLDDGSLSQVDTFHYDSPQARSVLTVTTISRDDNGWTNEFGNGVLTQVQETVLQDRMLHLLLRMVGCDLGFRSVDALFKHLAVYRAKEWWKEALDIAIVVADIMVQTAQSDECLARKFVKVGEALESCGLFHDAAEIYGQGATVYADSATWRSTGARAADTEGGFTRLLASTWQQVYMLGNQGLAYKRGEEWNLAEATNLQAFRLLFHSLEDDRAFDEDLFAVLATNIIAFYSVWHNEEEEGSTTARIVSYLLYLFKAMCSVSSVMRIQMDVAPEALLTPKYTKRRAAKNALKAALRTESVDSFRSTVLSWKKDGVEFNVLRDPTFSAGKKENKREARNVGKHAVPSVPKFYKCSHPTCATVREIQMMRCSGCKTVNYWQ